MEEYNTRRLFGLPVWQNVIAGVILTAVLALVAAITSSNAWTWLGSAATSLIGHVAILAAHPLAALAAGLSAGFTGGYFAGTRRETPVHVIDFRLPDSDTNSTRIDGREAIYYLVFGVWPDGIPAKMDWKSPDLARELQLTLHRLYDFLRDGSPKVFGRGDRNGPWVHVSTNHWSAFHINPDWLFSQAEASSPTLPSATVGKADSKLPGYYHLEFEKREFEDIRSRGSPPF